jgi:hypothetical protein
MADHKMPDWLTKMFNEYALKKMQEFIEEYEPYEIK